jgi:hypothetical protein
MTIKNVGCDGVGWIDLAYWQARNEPSCRK